VVIVNWLSSWTTREMVNRLCTGLVTALVMLGVGETGWQNLLHPMFTFEPQPLPDLRAKPVFIGAGRFDPLVPTEQTEQVADLLERTGAPLELFWHNGGHEVSVEEVKAAKEWIGELQ
jgi:predicted esterase